MDLKELERIRKKYNADWDEEDHDRDENGRFTSSGSREVKDINAPYIMSGDREAEEKLKKKNDIKKTVIVSENRIEPYKGYDIEYDFYGDGEYSVQYLGDDVVFESADEAKKFIDEITAE